MLAHFNHALVPAGRLQDRLDRLFGDFFQPVFAQAYREPFAHATTAHVPAINVSEDENAFHLEADLPGWTMEELEVSVLGDELTLGGERQAETCECTGDGAECRTDAPTSAKFLRRERSYGSFKRVLRFPTEVDAAKVTAQLRNGVLEVTLPKVELAKPRKIAVKTT